MTHPLDQLTDEEKQFLIDAPMPGMHPEDIVKMFIAKRQVTQITRVGQRFVDVPVCSEVLRLRQLVGVLQSALLALWQPFRIPMKQEQPEPPRGVLLFPIKGELLHYERRHLKWVKPK